MKASGRIWKGASPTGRTASVVRPAPHRRLPALATLAALATLLVTACGGRGGDDGLTPPPPPPDLSGVRVMLLPVRAPAPEQLDAELAFWLTQRSPTTEWLLPAELQAAADRAPAWRLRLDAIQRPIVEVGAGDRRVRDPLYGALRQLGAVVSSDYALVPVALAEVADSAGVQLALVVAVVDIRGGRVIWLHTVRGDGNPAMPGAVASLAEKVARIVVP